MFFPNIGSFQITLNDQLVFSKKKTNTWPQFQTIINDLSLKLYNKPFQFKQNVKKVQTNQTQMSNQFSQCDRNILQKGHKTLYKLQQSKNANKKFGKFTLTDHFKSFHQQESGKTRTPNHTNGDQNFYFDSSTTIKQSPQNKEVNKLQSNKINVGDIEGLRKALRQKGQSTTEQYNDSIKQSKKGNQKQILINLCSIEQEGNNSRQFQQFRVTNSTFKKTHPSAFINYQQMEQINGFTSNNNNSQKSLSLKKFEELNNDLRKIQKRFQHIQKKINQKDVNQGEQKQNYEQQMDQSRCNQAVLNAQNQKQRNPSQSGFARSNFSYLRLANQKQSSSNFLSCHIDKVNKQNKLLPFPVPNLQNSQIKVTDRYDQRYMIPTYYEENQLNKNTKCKKFSQIQKYLKSNNEEKNKKLKKIYGDWKVGTNSLNYLYYLETGKRAALLRETSNAMLRDSTNLNAKSRQKMRINMRSSSSNSNTTSSASSLEQRDLQTKIPNKLLSLHKQNNKQNEQKQNITTKNKKHSSFIIKHKSSHNNLNPVLKSKLSKQIKLNEKHDDLNQRKQINRVNENNGIYRIKQKQQAKQKRQTYLETIKYKQGVNLKQNSKSLQIKNDKARQINNQFIKRKHQSVIQHTKNLLKQVYRKQTAKSRKTYQIEKISQKLSEIDTNIKQEHQEIENQNIQTNDQKEELQTQNNQDTSVKQIEPKVTVQFHQFEHKKESKSKRPKIQKENQQNQQNELQKNQQKQNQIQVNLQKQQNQKDFTINQEVLITLDLNQMNQSQIMKTKTSNKEDIFVSQKFVDQRSEQHSNQMQGQNKQGVPYLNLKHNQDAPLQSDKHINCLLQHQHNIQKSRSSSGNSQSNRLNNFNHHSRSSSLYQQPTFSHAISKHNHDSIQPCKCEHRQQQTQTNRIKVLSQRKQKQMMKQKRIQENKKRREMLQKQKEEYLKQLELQIKEKRNSNKSSGRNDHTSSRKQSVEKENHQVFQTQKDKLQVSSKRRNQSDSKNRVKSSNQFVQQNNQKQLSKRKQQTSTNKPKKSVTQAQKSKVHESKPKKQTKSIADKNNKQKSQSKNPHIAKKAQQKPMNKSQLQTNKIKKQTKNVKQGKSISSQLHDKNGHLTKKAKDHRNKSYFKVQKQSRVKQTVFTQKHYEEQQNSEQFSQRNQQVQINSQRQFQRGKVASIAIQTMGFDQLRKYSSLQINQQHASKISKRNKSVQSRNSQNLSKRSSKRDQSIKQVKRNEIIKQVYSPVDIKGKKKNNRDSKRSIKNNSTIKKSQQQGFQSEKSIVNKFEVDQEQNEMMQRMNNRYECQAEQQCLQQKGFYVQYKGQRQKAFILRQLYNMDDHIADQLKQYEKLYQKNQMYKIFKDNGSNCITQDEILQNLISKNEEFHPEHQIQLQNLALAQVQSLLLSNQTNPDKISSQTLQIKQNISSNAIQNNQIRLFGKDSIQIQNLKSNQPYLTQNLHKVLHILCQKNQLLIVKLFQDYKSASNFNHKIQDQSDKNIPTNIRNFILSKTHYAVWLCIDKIWKLIVVDNVLPAYQTDKSSELYKPLFSYHKNNQLWPIILQKSLAKALGGYQQLFSLSVGQLFSILTGSNHVAYSINQNISKNKYFLRQIVENDKKNFIMVCEKYSTNLKEQNQKMNQNPKIFYLLSKKMVHNGQNEQILFKMRQASILSSESQNQSIIQNEQPYYIRYDKFCQKFKKCEALHLRQHNNYSSIKLNETIHLNKKPSQKQQNYFNVIQLKFDEQIYGSITVSNELKSDIKTYLYKLQNSDNQIMKLVGQASKINKKIVFFDCYFQSQKYYLFIQSSNPNCVISYIGEGTPEIKVKQKILSNGLRNHSIQYLPVSSYEGLQNSKNVMTRTFDSNLFSQTQSAKKPKTMDDLRQMFIDLLIQQRKRK